MRIGSSDPTGATIERAGASGASVWSRRVGGGGRPLIIAHRGASARAPDNTLRAFVAARAAAADAFETDLRLTGDGRVVCLHDRHVRGADGRDVPVGDLTFEGLRATCPDVPSLAEASEIGLPIFLDIKEDALDRILEILRHPQIVAEPDRFIVGVSTVDLAKAVFAACPAIAQVGLMREAEDFRGFAEPATARWGRIHAHRVTAERVAALRALGLRVMITCGREGGPVGDADPGELARLSTFVPDAVILNDPASARRHGHLDETS